MALHLLKRILLAIPALWLMATLIFLLSRSMPGTFGSETIRYAESGYYSKGDSKSREKNYRLFLNKTGQDLPLFYLSVSALAIPDSLHLLLPDNAQQLAKQMYWQYGDWPRVIAFYHRLQELENATPLSEQTVLRPYLHGLYQHTEPAQLRKAVLALESLTTSQQPQYTRLLEATDQLIAGQKPYAYLLPALQWHGTANQYHIWLTSLLQGDMGTSYRDKRPVLTVLWEAIGNTWWLLICSIGIAALVALELAILMVQRNGHIWRRTVLPGLFLLDSIPTFVLAMLLLVLLASPAFLRLFPVYGMGYYSDIPLTWLQSLNQWLLFMALPMLSLALANLPYLTNQFYYAIAGTASQDYIRTARAKGLSESAVIRRHMLRNALLPVITLLSDYLPALVAGAVIIETIFAIPGMGRLLIDSVLSRDYPIIIEIVVLIALFRLLTHLAADLLYALADPRIRHQHV